jgi:hypothetical protein
MYHPVACAVAANHLSKVFDLAQKAMEEQPELGPKLLEAVEKGMIPTYWLNRILRCQ